jgi:guanylate kinase
VQLDPINVNFQVNPDVPLLMIISGPSGVGKDSVLRALKKRNLPLHHVVTANTRPPRPDEREGIDYYFVSREKFEDMIENDELLEYSEVYEDYKGVPKFEVRKAISTNKDVIFRLDVQGAEKIKSIYAQTISIFLIPANQEEWIQRLGGRSQVTDKDLDTRIETVQAELETISKFDYVVVNAQNKLKETVDTIEAIITAEHHRTNKAPIDV